MVSEQVPKIVIRIKKRRIAKIGHGYHIMIPSAFIDRAEILEHGKEYNLVFEVPDEIRKNGNHWSLSHHSEIMGSFLNVSRNFSDSSQIQTF